MAKKSKNPLIIAGVFVVLVLVGIFVYSQQKDEPTQNQPTNTANCKTFDNKEYCAENYVGLKESEAISKAEDDGLTARIVAADDNRNIAINDNIQPKRINFTIANGVVTKAEFY